MTRGSSSRGGGGTAKPTALKILAGNPGKRRLRKPPQPTGRATCPRDLDPVARREWRRVFGQLDILGLATGIDRAGLAAYCSAWSQWCWAQRKIREETPVRIASRSGYPMVNAWFTVANAASKEMRYWMIEFGMTPAARERVTAETPPPARAVPPTPTEKANARDAARFFAE